MRYNAHVDHDRTLTFPVYLQVDAESEQSGFQQQIGLLTEGDDIILPLFRTTSAAKEFTPESLGDWALNEYTRDDLRELLRQLRPIGVTHVVFDPSNFSTLATVRIGDFLNSLWPGMRF